MIPMAYYFNIVWCFRYASEFQENKNMTSIIVYYSTEETFFQVFSEANASELLKNL